MHSSHSRYSHSDADTESMLMSPEKRLLIALLRRAVFDYFGSREAERSAAEEWLFTDDEDSTELFSFQWVCTQLDFSPSEILARLKTIEPLRFAAENSDLRADELMRLVA